MDQGILRFAWYSVWCASRKGYSLGAADRHAARLLLGLSKTFTRMFDPIIQILRPISPLAWLPLGPDRCFRSRSRRRSSPSRICSMWPTVLNTAVGVRAIPQDYLNVAKVLRLSRGHRRFTKVLHPGRRCPTCSPAFG